MNSNLSLQFKRVATLFCTIILSSGLCLSEVSEAKQFEDETVFEFDFETYVELKAENIKRANEVLQGLYSETIEDLAGTPEDPGDDVLVGAQAGYYIRSIMEEAYVPLVQYARVWIYDAGMALSLAVKNEDPTAHKRIMWLRKHAQTISDPGNSKATIFAGWPFSQNQIYLGDNWMDCRFITGANACALLGIAEYITSDLYKNLEENEQADHLAFFEQALKGILYHIELSGPNEGLIAAGWTINALKEFYKTDHSYGEILSMAGYGARFIDGYPYPVRRIRARNIVTEHCTNVLILLDYTLENYNELLGSSKIYNFDELAYMRLKLRQSIFNKLYDRDNGYFITGRSEFGVSSEYVAVGNASQLCLALELDKLTKNQIEALSKSLLHTVNSFTKDFTIDGKSYFGAHYFEDGFEDPYVLKADLHSDGLHIEGTCGLINSLFKFADAFPENPNAPLFKRTALKLWQSLQHLINDYGFIYASTSLKDVNEPLESSTSAILYLRTCDYIDANPEWHETSK